MTSIATYLASLTGAAPQEGQTATLANATGGVGLFAALIESSDATQGIEGETALLLDTNGLPIVAEIGQSENDGAALSEALTQGLDLPQAGADIEAEIIEGDAAQAELHLPENQITGEDLELQNTQSTGQRDLSEPQEEAIAVPVLQKEAASFEARQQINQTPGEGRQSSTGLENALGKAGQKGQENGLQAALSQAAQARGQGEKGQSAAAQGGNNTDAPRSEASRASDETTAIKPETSRSEFAPKNTEIIQRLIKTGNGQSTIQIQERTVGETAGVSSPPTLTVSVQAPVASPGPASATPHVPVSALAVHIAQQASNGARRFDISLNPPELGRIEVRLDVSREGQVMTHLVVERSETLDLLQRDARQLERALQNAGLDMSEDGMKFSLKDQGLAEGGDDDFNNGDETGKQAGGGEDDPSLIPDDAMPPPTRYMATSGLDIRI